ncbi:four helix bundle protein [Flavobacterium cellulosilyticum]|uniref:four helix bundle protein n=1 Tax=Flavobacterium cellulosilyticum TaxID=2541731 RepID=UPI001C707965|nr:four helix bundle protein [Flavobacterium cellulosilyticum]
MDCAILCSKLPNNREYNAYVNQLIRSSSSVGANYQTSQRAKLSADFINNLKIVEEEADESNFFLEILIEINKNSEIKNELQNLLKEGNEVLSIIVASIKKARNNQIKK